MPLLHRTPAIKEAIERANQGIKGRLDGHYQHEGVHWMLQRELLPEIAKGGILADDMGLGKTMQAIATMRGNPMTTLIITIVSTVTQWRDALIDFGGYKPVIINPSFNGLLPNDIDVAITTYSCFQKPKGAPDFFFSKQWGRIILDEGHCIRNEKTKIFTETLRLKSKVKWILSGTPIQNSQKDIVTLVKWIGKIGGDVEHIINEMVLRRTQEEQAQVNPRLALPPLDTHIVKLQFYTVDELNFYKRVEKHYMAKATNKADAMEAIMRCRQAANHSQLYIEGVEKKGRNRKRKRIIEDDDDDCDSVSLLPNAHHSKLNYLINDIKTQHNSKVLVFCTWTTEMKIIQEALKDNNISSLIYDGRLTRDNKDAVLYNFKNTNVKVLLLQIACGSAGLNLQCANKIYITSPHWNPCVELQAIGRAYRKGQMDRVTCIRLIMEGTIEDRCTEVQKEKVDIISEAMRDDSFAQRLGEMDA